MNVEPFHLDRCLVEQVFRFNNRATKDNPLNDAERFVVAMSQLGGGRIAYAQLTVRDADALYSPGAGTGRGNSSSPCRCRSFCGV